MAQGTSTFGEANRRSPFTIVSLYFFDNVLDVDDLTSINIQSHYIITYVITKKTRVRKIEKAISRPNLDRLRWEFD